MNGSDLKELQVSYKLAKIHLKQAMEYMDKMMKIVGGDTELRDYVEHSAGKDVHFLEIEDKLFNSEKRKREEDEKDLC